MSTRSILSQFESASHELAKEFVRKMYELESDEDMDEIYFISNDPAGTLGYGEEFWDLSMMYETLSKGYDQKDIWQYYWYGMDHHAEGEYMNIHYFMSFYSQKIKEWTTDEIYEVEMKKREANRLYWESPEGIAKDKEVIHKIKEKYLRDIA